MNNIIILIGVVARNIELRTMPSGKDTCNVTLAVKRNYKNSNGEYETDFITCKAFSQKAELISKYCKKGDTIGIKGMILTGSYEKDGKKVYTTDIMIQDISFLKQSKVEVKEEKVQDPFDKAIREFSKEADLNDIGIDDDGLPF